MGRWHSIEARQTSGGFFRSLVVGRARLPTLSGLTARASRRPGFSDIGPRRSDAAFARGGELGFGRLSPCIQASQ